ncbi:MAG: tRNA (adenosine(37)-N6)-dimethylallyltransferase MiaA [Acidobacteria bacterium]|uniref:tRNA dimethylallyltransferase n=1 Tax=Candidatus Polarisedimenticola svalbardensis TaxID=2886004 RepID=A0A8J7C151_9BACT|nr:tRNA (adenosine(37)-N6)-dimethylallyltransferase MiaA [Candidatus Polarisedimenticola svalbardensis]
MYGPSSGGPERVQGPEEHRVPVQVDRSPILVIAGPTGTGKTALALAVASEFQGEIVGCDALQVYRRFDTATAKPSREERSRAPYHLVDCVDPMVDYTLADYVVDADRAVAGIHGRGRLPIVAGGTGMYLRGLLKGILPAPARAPELRIRLNGMIARFGPVRMHRWLGSLDPASAARLPPADVQRVVRGIEIALTGERPWSSALVREGTWDSGEERYPTLKIGLHMERTALVRRIEARVDSFFEAGLIDEVRSLLASGVPEDANAFKAIGYREVLAMLGNRLPPDQVRDEVKKNTRRYSKRQRTWFRKEPGMHWLDMGRGVEEVASDVIRLVRDHGGLLPSG